MVAHTPGNGIGVPIIPTGAAESGLVGTSDNSRGTGVVVVGNDGEKKALVTECAKMLSTSVVVQKLNVFNVAFSKKLESQDHQKPDEQAQQAQPTSQTEGTKGTKDTTNPNQYKETWALYFSKFVSAYYAENGFQMQQSTHGALQYTGTLETSLKNVNQTHFLFPNKPSLATEATAARERPTNPDWTKGEHYAHDIIGGMKGLLTGISCLIFCKRQTTQVRRRVREC